MSKDLYLLVKKNRPLFWSVGDKQLQSLSEPSIVETILNFGDLNSVHQLFSILSTPKVADIFYKQIAQKRNNYYPQVSNFFDKYFQRHVQKYS